MKKVLSVILAMLVLVSFALFAVGSSDDDATSADTTYDETTLESISESEVDVPSTELETSETTTVEEETTTENVTVAQTVEWDVPPTTTISESSKTVYITKTGEKYHYENPCGNGKYYESTLAEAKAKGLGPCEKCVLH